MTKCGYTREEFIERYSGAPISVMDLAFAAAESTDPELKAAGEQLVDAYHAFEDLLEDIDFVVG